MNLERLFNLAGAIVSLATVAVVLQSPQTANVIKASASGFASSIKAAMGR